MTAVNLEGRVILVTRPQGQAGLLCRMIEQQGGQALRLPAVVIEPVEVSEAPLDPPPELIIFASRNAVLHGPTRVLRDRRPAPPLFAIGPGTAAELRALDLEPNTHASAQASSEALLALPALSGERVRGQRVVLVSGQGGRRVLQQTLEARGARVCVLEVYRRCLPDTPSSEVLALLAEGCPDTVVMTSRDGLHNLCQMIPASALSDFRALALVALTPPIAERARELGFTGTIRIAPETSDEGLLQALMDQTPASQP